MTKNDLVNAVANHGLSKRQSASVVESPEMQKRFQVEGAEGLRMTAAEFGQLVAAETAKWTRVVKAAKIKSE